MFKSALLLTIGVDAAYIGSHKANSGYKQVDPNDHEHKLGSSFVQAFAMFPPALIDEPKDPKQGMLSS